MTIEEFKKEDELLKQNICRHMCRHPEYGEGIITNISKHSIDVYFNNCKQKFKISDITNKVIEITTPYKDYFEGKVSIFDYNGYKINAIQKEILKENIPHKKNMKYTNHYNDTHIKYQKNRIAPLVGGGAMDISFRCGEEFVESLAYLSYPKTVVIHADVSQRDKDLFLELYPNSKSYTTVLEDRNVQYVIYVYKKEGMPYSLEMNETPKSQIGRDNWCGSEARIQRTLFTSDLVENLGFTFTRNQDIEKIYKNIPKEYKDIFIDKIKELDDIYHEGVYNKYENIFNENKEEIYDIDIDDR